MSTMVDILKNMLKQGVYPEHVLDQAAKHEADLDLLPYSEERDAAIRDIVKFMKELEKEYKL